ncbi:hypothetical protein MIMGU_mgv1a003623mg [Erythranthe guttata]|uniref:PGG domain-containing protein n=1 Tax=Erythranthe guttata TaxID=4155 RepID=A0A022QBW6_ERYGU|nr:hypothetical protein MIMGU_mgv1a003623mg [Erythranthe guttata]
MGRLDLMIESERGRRSTTTATRGRRRSHSRSQDNDHSNHVTNVNNDYDLYLSAKNGSLDDFSRTLHRVSTAERVPVGVILHRLSPSGNTFLHIAAKHGNEQVVAYIAAKDPSLMLIKNSFNGDTALHLAAKAGNESTVKTLVSESQDVAGGENNNLLRAKNERGNTALHETLINSRDSIAIYLIEKDPEVSYYENKEGESAFYLAAKAGSAECVSLILNRLSTDGDRINELFNRKYSPIQAAIEGKKRDNIGIFPIHLASFYGNVQVISFLLHDCPDPEEMLDGDGCNILHIAARNGRCNVVSYVLKSPYLKGLINMKNKYGNTPLHLATMNWHPKIVSALTWDNRVDVTLVNDKGMTALDAANHYMPDNPQFPQRLTWAALKAGGTPHSPTRKTTIGRQDPKKSSNKDNYKERVNTLLLVATLVATITFAAGFTVPGGYNTDTGMATMLRDKGFNIFIFCDAIAMYSSIVVAVTLIWAQLGDIKLALNALTLAVPLLGIALCMMSIAFTAGVFVVVSKLRWLSTAILVMATVFLVIMFIILAPMCGSHTSSNRIVRYLSYYPFYLLILASSS